MKWILFILLQLLSLNVAANWEGDASKHSQALVDARAAKLLTTTYTREYRNDLEYVRSACFHRSNGNFEFDTKSVVKLADFHFSNNYLFNNALGNDITYSIINMIDACSNLRELPNLHDRYAHHVIRIYQHHYALSYDGSDKVAWSIMSFYFNRGLHFRDQYSKAKILTNLYSQTFPLADGWLRNNIIWAIGKLNKFWNVDDSFKKLLSNNPNVTDLQIAWIARSSKYHKHWTPIEIDAIIAEKKKEIFKVLHPCNGVTLNTYKDHVTEVIGFLNTVKADFNKVFSNPKQIENDNPIIWIFPDRDTYRDWGTILFNIGTNNGGIYIDRDSTFYTFDRTLETNRFSLAQLVKHEYVHYLVESHVKHGEWRFDENRVYWDEGIAEAITAMSEGVQHLATYPVGTEIRGKGYSYRNIYPEAGRFFYDLYTLTPDLFFKEVKRFSNEFNDEIID